MDPLDKAWDVAWYVEGQILLITLPPFICLSDLKKVSQDLHTLLETYPPQPKAFYLINDGLAYTGHFEGTLVEALQGFDFSLGPRFKVVVNIIKRDFPLMGVALFIGKTIAHMARITYIEVESMEEALAQLRVYDPSLQLPPLLPPLDL
jgi:hypothetical protein